MSKIRTRFAPSPTGYLHLGGARTALYAWLYAKSLKGDCLLRIEDTDKERSEDKYTREIIQSFNWLEIDFDQEVVFQSNNFDRYKEVVNFLLDSGNAYVCKGEDLDEDKQYRNEKYLRDKTSVVRFKMPQEGSTSFIDLVKGEVSVSNDQLDDFIIERSDGSATYNFCAVIDDLDSKITHVIRGDDHVNNTFKQINVFKALGKDVPEYGHVPMILGEDGKRLSKRHGALSISEYAEMGILPEALKNYLLRLGWSMGDSELFTHEEMQLNFQKGTLNQSPSTFSQEKLLWYNKHYLFQLTLNDLSDLLQSEQFDGSQYSNDVLKLIRDRCSTLKDFYTHSLYFFEDPKEFDAKLVQKHINDESHSYLEILKSNLTKLDEWHASSIKAELDRTVEELSVGFGKVGLPLRLALTATVNSPSIDAVCDILGKNTTLKRLDLFLNEIKH